MLPARRFCEPVSLATAALAVGLQLLFGVRAQPLGQLRRLGARIGQVLLARLAAGRQFALGGGARLGEHRLGRFTGVAQHLRRPFLGDSDDLGCGRLHARPVEDLRTFALGPRANRLRLGARVSKRPLGRLGCCIDAAARALKRRPARARSRSTSALR